jgi:hypothetical protein
MPTQGIPTFETKLLTVPDEESDLEPFGIELDKLTRDGWNVVGVVQAVVVQSMASRGAVLILSKLYGAAPVELHAPAVQGVTLEVAPGGGKRNGGGGLIHR